MPIESRINQFTETFDHLQIINYLQDSGNREIEAFDEVTREIIILTLNFNQEVCIKKGKNLILVRNQRILIPKLETAKTKATKGNIEEAKINNQYNFIANGLNEMINSVIPNNANIPKSSDRYEKNQLEPKESVNGYDWITHFKVITPVFCSQEDLANLYIDSILDSLDELESDIIPPEDENDVVLIATEGYVKNDNKVKDFLNKLIKDNELEYIYQVQDNKQPYTKLVVWRIING